MKELIGSENPAQPGSQNGDPLLSMAPKKIVEWVNGINPYFFILFILVLFFFRFSLNWNEEHYMALAKQFYEPDWMPGSFTFSEFAGTRAVFQYLIGFLLSFLSFETAVGVVRLLLCLVLAFPLAKLYKLFGLTNIFILLQLPILFFFQGKHLFTNLYNQSFFGGEWIFLGVEPKVFAYIFVLYALYFLLTEKAALSTIFLAMATYFHILAGGWAMFYFLLYMLIAKKSFKIPFINGVLYVACLIPFLLYLAPVLSHTFTESGASGKADWIFSYYKQPFHTGIFLSVQYFIDQSFNGFMLSAFFFLLCVFLFSRYQEKYNLKLNLLNKIIFIGTLMSVILAYFDRTAAFVKYFPFRINALYCFLVFLQLALFLQYFALKKETARYVEFAVLLWFVLITLPLPLWSLTKGVYVHVTGKQADPSYEAVCDYIKEHTPGQATILYLPGISQQAGSASFDDFDGYPDMARKTQRDRFVYHFAAPISPDAEKTLEWYRRILLKESIIEGSQDICTALEDEKVDYILTAFELENSDCYDLMFQSKDYRLYELIRN